MMRFLKPGLLVFAVINLVTGMLSGLGRLGWAVPIPEANAHHGAIMVGGFLGSLIALEKVIPLKRIYFYAGPLLSASSILVFLFGDFHFAVAMQVVAGLIFAAVYVTYLRVQFSELLLLALAGVVCWLVGTVLLFWKQFYPMVLPWWMGFLLFTIVSERLELSRFLPVTAAHRRWLYGFLVVYVVSLLIPFHIMGKFLAGFSLVFTSAWLLRYDLIRITLHKEGLARFTAVSLLCGYIALAIEGVLLVALRDQPFAYDMIVHTFFLGFVFSMIFAHGPIILPGVLGLSVKPYHAALYLPVTALWASLAVRLAADGGLISLTYRAWSGWITMGSILLYFVLMIVVTIRSFRTLA